MRVDWDGVDLVLVGVSLFLQDPTLCFVLVGGAKELGTRKVA